MNRRITHICRILLPLAALLAVGCTKEAADYRGELEMANHEHGQQILKEDLLAVATLRSKDGVRYLQLDPKSVGYVVNPESVADVPDGTRLFLQYKSFRADDKPSFCTESVWVDWVSPLDVGEVAASPVGKGDPVDIVTDWITSLEDGFLTLHYVIRGSGKEKHGFTLCATDDPTKFVLVHDAKGETEGSPTDGIVCFPVDGLLPDTGGSTVTLSLTYLNLDNTLTTLTVDYRTIP